MPIAMMPPVGVGKGADGFPSFCVTLPFANALENQQYGFPLWREQQSMRALARSLGRSIIT